MPIKLRNKESPEYKAKMKWIASLKVGDIVCDCRMHHVKISQIQNNTVVRMPGWVRTIIFSNLIPYAIGNFLDDAFCWLSKTIGYVELVDRSLVLEDGSLCSAMNCCEPLEHLHNNSRSQ